MSSFFIIKILIYCDNTDTLVISVKPLPVPQFLHDTLVCEFDLVIFNNTSMDGVNYFWDFDNNSTSTSINPTTSYIDTGLYTINLYVTSLFGCVDSTSSLIEIIDPPIAAISFIDSGCAPLEIAFDNSSYGKYCNFSWDFGNGSTSNDSIPINQIYNQSYTTDTPLIIFLFQPQIYAE